MENAGVTIEHQGPMHISLSPVGLGAWAQILIKTAVLPWKCDKELLEKQLKGALVGAFLLCLRATFMLTWILPELCCIRALPGHVSCWSRLSSWHKYWLRDLRPCSSLWTCLAITGLCLTSFIHHTCSAHLGLVLQGYPLASEISAWSTLLCSAFCSLSLASSWMQETSCSCCSWTQKQSRCKWCHHVLGSVMKHKSQKELLENSV